MVISLNILRMVGFVTTICWLQRDILAVRTQAAQTFDRKRFNLKKLNYLEVRKQYQIEITNRFAALENLKMRTRT
jgi:hypothetical protein